MSAVTVRAEGVQGVIEVFIVIVGCENDGDGWLDSGDGHNSHCYSDWWLWGNGVHDDNVGAVVVVEMSVLAEVAVVVSSVVMDPMGVMLWQ